MLGNNRVVGSGGTQPSFADALRALVNPSGEFPGGVAGGTWANSSFDDGPAGFTPVVSIILAGTTWQRDSGAGLGDWHFDGIRNFKVVLRALEQRDGADLLNEGFVTTLERQTGQFRGVRCADDCYRREWKFDRWQPPADGRRHRRPNVVQNLVAAINYMLDTAPTEPRSTWCLTFGRRGRLHHPDDFDPDRDRIRPV